MNGYTVKKILSSAECRQYCREPDVHIIANIKNSPGDYEYFLAEDEDNFLMICNCDDRWLRVAE